MSTKSKGPRFHVGDWVTFPFGFQNAVAKIIEDRGPIGVKGRRLYRVELLRDGLEPDRFEVREDDLTTASPPKTTAKVT